MLVACEYSGTVRDAFSALGHEAWSCDLLPTDSPGLHYQGDVRDILEGWTPVRHHQDGVEYKEINGRLFGRPLDRPGWDLMIAHPPCTYLCSSGLHWNKRRPERERKTEEALAFVRLLLDSPIPRIALENPVGCVSTRIRKPDQIMQPWQFGHPESKATCLWLKDLPPLIPTNVLPKPASGRWDNQTASGQNKLPPSKDRWKVRSKTYTGIALAMAEQWSLHICT